MTDSAFVQSVRAVGFAVDFARLIHGVDRPRFVSRMSSLRFRHADNGFQLGINLDEDLGDLGVPGPVEVITGGSRLEKNLDMTSQVFPNVGRLRHVVGIQINIGRLICRWSVVGALRLEPAVAARVQRDWWGLQSRFK